MPETAELYTWRCLKLLNGTKIELSTLEYLSTLRSDVKSATSNSTSDVGGRGPWYSPGTRVTILCHFDNCKEEEAEIASSRFLYMSTDLSSKELHRGEVIASLRTTHINIYKNII
jgi:hypothetical protein